MSESDSTSDGFSAVTEPTTCKPWLTQEKLSELYLAEDKAESRLGFQQYSTLATFPDYASWVTDNDVVRLTGQFQDMEIAILFDIGGFGSSLSITSTVVPGSKAYRHNSVHDLHYLKETLTFDGWEYDYFASGRAVDVQEWKITGPAGSRKHAITHNYGVSGGRLVVDEIRVASQEGTNVRATQVTVEKESALDVTTTVHVYVNDALQYAVEETDSTCVALPVIFGIIDVAEIEALMGVAIWRDLSFRIVNHPSFN